MSAVTTDSFKIRTFLAEQVHLYAATHLADLPALRDHLRVSDVVGTAARESILQITTWCLSGRIPTRTESRTIEYPDGVWQMVKHKYMPWWFVKRFPIRMNRTVVECTTHHYFVCPHLVSDSQSRHVQFMATGTDMAKFL